MCLVGDPTWASRAARSRVLPVWPHLYSPKAKQDASISSTVTQRSLKEDKSAVLVHRLVAQGMSGQSPVLRGGEVPYTSVLPWHEEQDIAAYTNGLNCIVVPERRMIAECGWQWSIHYAHKTTIAILSHCWLIIFGSWTGGGVFSVFLPCTVVLQGRTRGYV
jgi:hypothetical protein